MNLPRVIKVMRAITVQPVVYMTTLRTTIEKVTTEAIGLTAFDIGNLPTLDTLGIAKSPDNKRYFLITLNTLLCQFSFRRRNKR